MCDEPLSKIILMEEYERFKARILELKLLLLIEYSLNARYPDINPKVRAEMKRREEELSKPEWFEPVEEEFEWTLLPGGFERYAPVKKKEAENA
jgi:hypothetical protein